jgi:hypothetical protein
MGAEKSGVGAVSIRRREAVGLDQGDIRTKPILMMGTERQQTVQSHVSGVPTSQEQPSGDQASVNSSVPLCCWYRPPRVRAKIKLGLGNNITRFRFAQLVTCPTMIFTRVQVLSE